MKHLHPYNSLAVLPLIITALALSGCDRGNRPVSAEAFLKDFNNDRGAAYEKYKDKDILLTGKTALDTKEYSGGRVILTLEGGVGTLDMIFCENEGTSLQIKDSLLKVKKGESVEVKGRLSSIPALQPMVQLKECQLQP
jgi:tRNA_anti-like